MNKILITFISLLFLPIANADYEFTINWISPAGYEDPRGNGQIVAGSNIREYRVKNLPIGETNWASSPTIHTELKSQIGEMEGYSYAGIATEPGCYQIMTVLMGWGWFMHGGTVCIDPTKELPPASCTTEAVTCQ